ncbi:M23 family metallopeptidase [Verrucomicrobiales bacterium BCK34]|nr:M23 family metallopeptidase [Verrucomicrobiales bacterium BCK34]
MLKKPVYFDIKQHLKEWHQLALPIFVIVAAVGLVTFLITRNNEESEKTGFTPARIGLLAPGPDALFDPAFAIASPVEMVSAPTTDRFDYPVGSRHGAGTYNAQPFLTNKHLGDDLNGIGGQNSDLGDPVFAAADGLVVFAGWPSDGWGNVVILLHELENGRLIESFYAHLDSIHVPIGKQLRRGDQLGTIGTAGGRYLAHLHFELRRYSSLDVGAGYAESKQGRLPGEASLMKWRNRRDNQLAPPVTGAPIEPGSLNLDVDESNDSDS